jgi:hypothetical protein
MQILPTSCYHLGKDRINVIFLNEIRGIPTWSFAEATNILGPTYKTVLTVLSVSPSHYFRLWPGY